MCCRFCARAVDAPKRAQNSRGGRGGRGGRGERGKGDKQEGNQSVDVWSAVQVGEMCVATIAMAVGTLILLKKI